MDARASAASLGGEFWYQGVSLLLLADRTGDAAMAERALHQITKAHRVTSNDGQAANTAYYAAQIPEVRAVLERLRTL